MILIHKLFMTVFFSVCIGDSELLRSRPSLWREIREKLILNAGHGTNCSSVFHILDSLRDGSSVSKEGKLLQTILLKHFEGIPFVEGRIATNLAQAKYLVCLACIH